MAIQQLRGKMGLSVSKVCFERKRGNFNLSHDSIMFLSCMYNKEKCAVNQITARVVFISRLLGFFEIARF